MAENTNDSAVQATEEELTFHKPLYHYYPL